MAALLSHLTPSITLTLDLMFRWSCSIRLFKYLEDRIFVSKGSKLSSLLDRQRLFAPQPAGPRYRKYCLSKPCQQYRHSADVHSSPSARPAMDAFIPSLEKYCQLQHGNLADQYVKRAKQLVSRRPAGKAQQRARSACSAVPTRQWPCSLTLRVPLSAMALSPTCRSRTIEANPSRPRWAARRHC
jgi:hypothetical protein